MTGAATDITQLIERLRATAQHRAGTDNRLSLPEEFIESEAAAALADLQAQLRIAEKRAEDAESRNDFLITELDELIRKART
jgi:hypothetical protein